jgi:hypothetical protein
MDARTAGVLLSVALGIGLAVVALAALASVTVRLIRCGRVRRARAAAGT